jgi:hypothetical protein
MAHPGEQILAARINLNGSCRIMNKGLYEKIASARNVCGGAGHHSSGARSRVLLLTHRYPAGFGAHRCARSRVWIFSAGGGRAAHFLCAATNRDCAARCFCATAGVRPAARCDLPASPWLRGNPPVLPVTLVIGWTPARREFGGSFSCLHRPGIEPGAGLHKLVPRQHFPGYRSL